MSTHERLSKIARWILSGNSLKRIVNGVHQKIFDQYPISSAETVRSTITQWYEEQSSDSPKFMFINFMDVHEPYQIRKRFLNHEHSKEGKLNDVNWNLSSLNQAPVNQSIRELMISVYDSSIQYLDSQLDDLLTWVNGLDDTILVFTSDHGQSLGDHNYWGHGTFLYDELINIPLFVNAADEYLNSWPKTSKTISIGELPYYILNSVDESFTSGSSVLQNTAAKKIQGGNAPVMAESRGAHEEGDYQGQGISREGYRTVHMNGMRLLRNLDDNTIDVSGTGPSRSKAEGQIHQQLENLESNLLSELKSIDTTNDEQELNPGTKERLEDLGYM